MGKGEAETFTLAGSDHNVIGGGECRVLISGETDNEVADHSFFQGEGGVIHFQIIGFDD